MYCKYMHGWNLPGCSWISGFRYCLECSKNGFEMHFLCEFSAPRIKTLPWSCPCIWLRGIRILPAGIWFWTVNLFVENLKYRMTFQVYGENLMFWMVCFRFHHHFDNIGLCLSDSAVTALCAEFPPTQKIAWAVNFIDYNLYTFNLLISWTYNF